ncbi:hypothetical protein SLEP1_g49071 [Rubroshorea leprosula]|uniref:Uncharacterized protein n=1 Tax=Rubroshorea leprosula TaxID=152421 RepID=A0AAV5LVS5_9ROSI|nr:hypothetical protein SLEP1_g49071 [Rubroshorea leprosula]
MIWVLTSMNKLQPGTTADLMVMLQELKGGGLEGERTMFVVHFMINFDG